MAAMASRHTPAWPTPPQLAPEVFGLGWEGLMLLAGVAALAGITPFAYAVLSGYLWVLFIWDFLSGWLRSTDGDDG